MRRRTPSERRFPQPVGRVGIVVLVATLLAGGCAGGGASGRGEPPPEFPREPVAADFPGTSYPETERSLPAPGARGGPVWLIGVDGATWSILRPLIDSGEAPAFAELVRDGASGVLHSEEPMISPALWATIATGVPRFVHGVVDFSVKLPGRPEAVRVGPADRRAPALWDLVGAAGGRSAVVGWFGSYPAEPIAGEYVSKGFDPEHPDPREVHPPGLLDDLVASARIRLRRGDVEAIARTDFLRDALIEDARTMAAARVVLDSGAHDLVAIYFSGIDVVQHVTWGDMDPATRAFPDDGAPHPELADVIPAYSRYVDDMLGELLRLAPDDATIVVVSDHGGGALEPAQAFHFQLDVLLEAMGLGASGSGEAMAFGELYRHDKRIWLNLQGVERDGVVPEEAADETAERIAARLTAMRTDDGSPVFATVVDRTGEPNWRPGSAALRVRFSGAALLAASFEDGDRTIDAAPVRLRHTDVSGAHRPEGVIALRGPAIRRGASVDGAGLYAVAPTVLYLLGLPQDRGMLRWAPVGGGVIEAAIDPAALQRSPVRMVATYPGTDREEVRRQLAEQRDAEIDPRAGEQLERLRGLGYVR